MDLQHIKNKIVALQGDGRSVEQITNLILSEHKEEFPNTSYAVLYPVVKEVVSRQQEM